MAIELNEGIHSITPNSRKVFWTALIVWTLISVGFTIRSSIYQLSVGQPVYWFHIFLYNFNSAFIWSLLTPIIFRYCHLIQNSSKHWSSLFLAHTFAALVVAPLHTFVFLALDFYIQNQLKLWLSSMTLQQYYLSYFWELLIEAMLTYALVVGLIYGYIFYLKNQDNKLMRVRLESSLLNSRITNLKYQFQPHFLFNSMQMISNLMHQDVKLADKAIAELGEILRYSIHQLSKDFTSLHTELEITKKYLEMQKLRFPDKLNYSIDSPEELGEYQLPVLLIQPLVENSIKHGLEKTGQNLRIEISITDTEGHLQFQVKDDGPGISKKQMTKAKGAGLENLKERLRLFYMDDFEFHIGEAVHGTYVQISIPKQKSVDDGKV